MRAVGGKVRSGAGRIFRCGGVPGGCAGVDYSMESRDLGAFGQAGSAFAELPTSESASTCTGVMGMQNVALLGQLALAVGVLGWIARGVAEQITELRTLTARGHS
jgi:hypothetical protein